MALSVAFENFFGLFLFFLRSSGMQKSVFPLYQKPSQWGDRMSSFSMEFFVHGTSYREQCAIVVVALLHNFNLYKVEL